MPESFDKLPSTELRTGRTNGKDSEAGDPVHLRLSKHDVFSVQEIVRHKGV
jgi:hypothetical protein